ncbi:DNA mismatch repair protein MutS [Atopobacter sp. AH10]|uniref:DNA mismatch repair protein MutS n=1 Tax=Atopobacter sp. AH10 TaxID=2315861 RepID=UPI000EF23BE7|nr:DNA mismatch repair protein MutS [Atopobacter sp. AH10]RLK63232.1 DNA mismatch repair protein MutS [Atopobacter sp. AH10]
MAKQTPMMAQYQAIKDQYPDAFLFYRLGDFYELFNDDALKASRILEITLTSRNKNSETSVPMCGVPHHAAHDYIKTLVQQGYKVAICEQMEDPKLTKGMVKREVVQVVTPGTFMDDEDHQQRSNNYLLAFCPSGDSYALSAVDLNTGEWLASLLTKEEVAVEIATLKPAEILLPKEVDASFLPSFSRDVLLSRTEFKDKLPAIVYENEETPKSLKTACRLIMSYLVQTQMKQIAHLQPVRFYKPSQYLAISVEALEQLELVENRHHGRQKGTLLAFLDKTQTAMGARLLKQWLQKPLIDEKAINKRYDALDLLMNNYFSLLDIGECLGQVYDLERLVARLAMNEINPRDMMRLSQSLKVFPKLREILSSMDRANVLMEHLDDYQDLKEVAKAIDTALADDPPAIFKNGGVIRAAYNEQLDQYRETLDHANEWLLDIEEREKEKTGVKKLKIGYNKVFGYYIEISKAQLRDAHTDHLDRKQTLTNAERFISSELKDLETKIVTATDNALALEEELFNELKRRLLPYRDLLQSYAKDMAQLDVYQALAQVALDHQLVRPKISLSDRTLAVKQSRHPVVESVLEAGTFVSNDVCLGQNQRIQLITGPNMAGKSTYMRQIALIAIMAQMGSFVPAEAAQLPIFTKLFTRIGASDDLYSGKSTFMVEMMETKEALLEGDAYSLLLFDEIGRGTATYDGMALAQAIIEYLAEEMKAVVFFSTHYHELTDLSQKYSCIQNVYMEAIERNGQLSFSHLVKEGAADRSYGIHVARLAGMPEKIVQKADKILTHLEDEGKDRRQPIKGQEWDGRNGLKGNMDDQADGENGEADQENKSLLHIKTNNKVDGSVLENEKTCIQDLYSELIRDDHGKIEEQRYGQLSLEGLQEEEVPLEMSAAKERKYKSNFHRLVGQIQAIDLWQMSPIKVLETIKSIQEEWRKYE